MKKYLIILTAVFIFFVLLFYFPNNSRMINSVQIAGQEIRVELASTTTEQNKGLSGRSELPENSGMLFVFAEPGKHSFWMKDMNFPIDIVWFTPSEGGDNSNLKVVYIKKNATPETYPEAFTPNVDAKYVLEISAGFSDKNNLKVGDTIVLK